MSMYNCTANAWFAWSGMETVPLAWILMRCARLAGDLCEPRAGTARPARDVARSLALAGFAAPYKVSGTATEYVRVGDQGARFTFRFCPMWVHRVPHRAR